MQYHAETSWLGLLLFAGVLLFQVLKAFSRGKVESEQEPTPPPLPRGNTPVPSKEPTPASSNSLEKLFQELSKGLEQVPETKQPKPLPPPLRAKPRPAPIPSVLRESKSSDLQNDPAGLMTRMGTPLYETEVEKVKQGFSEVPTVLHAEPERDRFSWLRERLRDRTETQRAIILNEVLQTPLGFGKGNSKAPLPQSTCPGLRPGPPRRPPPFPNDE